MSESDLHATTLPDGRVVYTRPEREGPCLARPARPRALGRTRAALPREVRRGARVDGGALTDEDRAHLHDALGGRPLATRPLRRMPSVEMPNRRWSGATPKRP